MHKIKMLLIVFFFLTQQILLGSFKPAEMVHKRVTAYMKKYKTPGLMVGLFYEGKPYYYSFGYADLATKKPINEHTIFEIGSLTKSFTATLLALEVLKGRLHLQEPLAQCITFFNQHHCPIDKITLEQLATHTSGLPRKAPVKKMYMTKPRVLHALLRWKSPEIPADYLYSNLGYNLLGYALEETSHSSYEHLLEQNILRPLGMHDTMLTVPRNLKPDYAQGYNLQGVPVPRMRYNALGAAGSLKSNIIDMMQFLKANLFALGSEELKKALALTHKGFFQVKKNVTQALSWQRITSKRLTLIDKNGGVTGFSTWMGFVEKGNYGIILLSNGRNPELTGLGRHLLHDISGT